MTDDTRYNSAVHGRQQFRAALQKWRLRALHAEVTIARLQAVLSNLVRAADARVLAEAEYQTAVEDDLPYEASPRARRLADKAGEAIADEDAALQEARAALKVLEEPTP